jgi:glycosyltransferase involved in cell wall biosynthesis
MKVLHLISSSGMYGAEAVILNLSRTLNRQGHRSMVGAFSNGSNPNHQLHERALQEGIESHLIPCRGQVDRAAISGIRELALRTGADIVHAHGYKADIYGYFALRGTAVPFVSTCHNWLDNDLPERLYGAADRFVLRRYGRVVAVSNEVQKRLLTSGVNGKKIRRIRNGIDLQPFADAAPSFQSGSFSGGALVGLVGRLSPEKGIDIFLHAASRVLAEFPETSFVLIGEGPDQGKLEVLADQLKIRNNGTWLGRREDMPAIYASFDVMVSASRREGLPMTILEAMASGLPLVATAVGEVPNIVLDNNTGLLVKPEDVEALAEGILELLRDPSKRTRIGIAAKKLVQDEYSADRMASDYLHAYAEAIAERKSAKNRAGAYADSIRNTK